MIRDVFYLNNKPNVHPRENPASSVEHARQLATTEHFWIISEYCDYRNFDWDFDFDFLPDEDQWTQDHNNVWPSQHQKDSGTWLCPKQLSDIIVYRNDVDPVIRKNEITEHWVLLDKIDKTKFDFTWHPDPTSPPYIYRWGCKYFPVEEYAVLEYHVPGATQVKYLNTVVELLPADNWKEYYRVNHEKFDFTWRPDPRDPPFIYTWGNKWVPAEIAPTIEFHVDNATEVKFMDEPVDLLPDWSKWTENELVDKTKFDFTWVPNPYDPPFIYKWGCKYFPVEEQAVLEYRVDGATEVKFMDDLVELLPDWDRWQEIELVDKTKFDFTWRPDPKDPPFIYKWGCKYFPVEEQAVLEYHVLGATEIKFMDEPVDLLPDWSKWTENELVDKTKFDFTWRPDPKDPPFIYKWGCKYFPVEEQAVLEYHVLGATEIKFMDDLVDLLPDWSKWTENELVDKTKFDFTWRPDPKDPAYIYKWGCKYFPVEEQAVLEYRVDGATEIKFMDEPVDLLPDWSKWTENELVDKTKFDFTWRPDPKDPPFIYKWGCKYFPVEEQAVLEYHVPNAREIKFMDDLVDLLPDWSKWTENELVDKTKFDFTWRPDPKDPPFIYAWGNQWNTPENKISVQYAVPGATQYKFMTERTTRLPSKNSWQITDDIVIDHFDFSWEPNPKDLPFIYVFGNNHYPAEIMPTVRYIVKDATDLKYSNDLIAILGIDQNKWKKYPDLHVDKFDFTWVPNPYDPPFIYKWGCKYFPVEEQAVLEYHVLGATEIKFMDDLVELLPDWDRWQEIELVDKTKFDFTWRPDPKDPPFIYKWGCKYFPVEEQAALEYHVPNAREIKFMDDLVELLPDWDRWQEIELVDKTKFDFTWRPDPKDPAYIYKWGCKYFPVEEQAVLEYRVDGATEIKFMDDLVELLPDWDRWHIIHQVDKNSFDFTWRPDPKEPPMVYVFGNKQYSSNVMPTIEYRVPGATERKYMHNIKASLVPVMSNWYIPENFDINIFDFSWRPDPHSPSYIYQFGTIADKNDGPKYITPKNTGEIVYIHRVETVSNTVSVKQYTIETTLQDLVNKHPTEIFWAIRKNIDYTNFDFTWRPELIDGSWESEYISVFGSSESELTQTYFVNARSYLNGNTNIKFIEQTDIDERSLAKLFKKPDMFFIDRYNKDATQRFDQLKKRFPNLQKTRYMNTWVDTINRCVKKSTTELFWILDSQLDYSDFDFDYYPNPWQMKMLTVFGTQWSRWGTTFLVNSETFPEDTKYINIIEHVSAVNFVKDKKAKTTDCYYDMVLIDHGNKEAKEISEFLALKCNLTIVKYDGSYIRTIRNLVNSLPRKKDHYIWLCSSVCDYKNFDFSYLCDPFARDQLHVFPSDQQKFGDTFFIDVNKTRTILESITSLEDYEKINFNQTMRATRVKEPTIIVPDDAHVTAINFDMDFPYTTLISETDKDIVTTHEPMNLWSPRTKTIIVTSEGATKIVVPREAREYIKREVYDYPYIKRSDRLTKSHPMDIVFLSNGESCADEHYEHLLSVTKNLKNRVTRVDGVNGRAQAYHAALAASTTPWAFTIFAKLKINPEFDFDFQPDRLQIPKHYIFYAKNPVNNLVYGHQAAILYNKRLVLANTGKGLDFTLDDEHEVVPALSGTAYYNTDAFSTWRTSFREALKLKASVDKESKERLDVWLTVANGEYSEFSLKGAKDAVDYYQEVAGDFEKLKLSYEWKWLLKKFDK